MASKEKPTSFADLMAAIDAAANNYAIQQAGAEIQKSSGTLSPQQIAALASAFKERAKYLRDGADSGDGDADALFKLLDDAAVSDNEPEPEPMTKLEEWDKFYGENGCGSEILRVEGLAGKLQDSHIRSLAWKVYLGVLDADPKEWEAQLAKQRQYYDDTVKELVVDPHSVQEDDLSKNNPLAVDDDAPWQQYFKDTQFRKEITQDVTRTFPEEDFFRDEAVQEDLLNILFCYSRRFPDLSYRQGMHEVCALLYMAVHRDRLEASDPIFADAPDMMKVVLDAKFIAHDVYALFSNMMETATDWFIQNKSTYRPTRKSSGGLQPLQTTPFEDQANLMPSSAILTKLDHVHKVVVKKYDSELYHRLQLLDIAPSIYGLRWIRVLFAREFNFSQTFRVWDAIFADSATMDLLDYVFVAMLCHHRQTILTKDSMDCMRLLMSPLEVSDHVVHTIVEHALHIRNPKKYPRPSGTNATPRAAGATSSASAPPRAAAQRPKTPAKRASAPAAVSTQRSTTQKAPQMTKQATSKDVHKPTYAPVRSASPKAQPSAAASSTAAKAAPQPTEPMVPASIVQTLEAKVAIMESQKDTLQAMNKYFGEKLGAYIDQLQEELLVTDRLPNDEVIFLALAGIKQVKDVLRGYKTPKDLGFDLV